MYSEINYDEKDPTTLLWGQLYHVTVPSISMETVEGLKQKGRRVTGIPEIDRDRLNQTTQAYWNIATIVHAWQEGAPVSIVSRVDTRIIYKSVDTYLNIFKEHMQNMGMNSARVPTDDLVMLDEFAEIVYGHAESSIADFSEPLDPFTKRFGGLDLINSIKLSVLESIKQENPDKSEDKDPDAPKSNRVSLREFFISKNLGRT